MLMHGGWMLSITTCWADALSPGLCCLRQMLSRRGRSAWLDDFATSIIGNLVGNESFAGLGLWPPVLRVGGRLGCGV